MSSDGSSSLTSTAPVPSLPKGRAKACTNCRQVKLRCDAKEVFPAPCSRCMAQKLECKMDSTFKRVAARRQLEEVSTRLNNLQRTLGIDQAGGKSRSPAPAEAKAADQSLHSLSWAPAPDSRYFSDLSSRVARYPSTTPESSTIPGRWLDLEVQDEEDTWPLGDVELSSGDIRKLFQHFDEHLCRHIPILEPCTSLRSYYTASKLLFWTVALVSCKFNSSYHELYFRLQPHHEALLAASLFKIPQSMKTLHSLLLVCIWPYPINSQFDDPVWVLMGTVINMAMTMGLHEPGHQHEYGRPMNPAQGSIYTRNVTWIFIFQTSTSFSSWFGMPPPLNTASHLDTISLLCRDAGIPRILAARADIQREVARSVPTLVDKIDLRTRHSLIKLFESDLDRVRTTFRDVWSAELDIDLLAAKLYLYGLAFVAPDPSDEDNIEPEAPPFAARDILQRGLSAGVRLLYTARHLPVSVSSPGGNTTQNPGNSDLGIENYISQIGFYPKHFWRLTGFAVYFLLWFLAVDLEASDTDKELARNYVSATHRLFMSFTNSPEHIRVAHSFEILGRIPNTTGKTPQLRVNSRLGASFMYDAMYNAVFYREGARATALEDPRITELRRIAETLRQRAEMEEAGQRRRGSQKSNDSMDTAEMNQVQQQQQQQQHVQAHHEQMQQVHVQQQQQQHQHHQQRYDWSRTDSSLDGSVHESIEDATFDPANTYGTFEQVPPDFQFPWGVWDNAIYDTLNMDVEMSQAAGYVGEGYQGPGINRQV